MKLLLVYAIAVIPLAGADLPVRRVVIYKNGVAYFERAGEVKPGETARLEFAAAEMNDLLKSLVIEDRSGGKVTSVRYELSEPSEKRLARLAVPQGQQLSLAALLDYWKGARVELRTGAETLSGTIVSARLAPLPNQGQRQELVLLAGDGMLRVIDLAAVTSLRLLEAGLQRQLEEALGVLSGARAQDKRSVWIEGAANQARQLVARYLAPAPVWKSSYRLIMPAAGDSTLEGWAIVDNASGDDWNNIELTVVSGKPVSFITELYAPRTPQREVAALPEDRSAAPALHAGALAVAENAREARPDRLRAKAEGLVGGVIGGISAARAPAPALAMESSVAEAAEGQQVGDLFEYHFPSRVTARKGESAMIPFVQQKIAARRLLIYSDRSSQFPRSAVELTNNTGKTLDGGAITIYQEGSYGGEALMETLKASDKRLISFAVDLGTRVTTAFDSANKGVREVRLRRGILTTRMALETTTTYTIHNVDARAKTLLVEHPAQGGAKLVKPKEEERTANAYRFSVPLAAGASTKLEVVEERELEQSISATDATVENISVWLQNRALSAAARKQLEDLAAKKRALAATDTSIRRTEAEVSEITRDQERVRQNISSLNRVAGQTELVQKYVAEMTRQESSLAGLRDRLAGLRKQRDAQQAEISNLLETMEF